MKQRNTHPFSVSPHNAEKANGFAAQIPEALLLLAGFMALGAGLAATWSGYGWLCLLVGAAAACWQCAARQLWRGWAGVALPLLILCRGQSWQGAFPSAARSARAGQR